MKKTTYKGKLNPMYGTGMSLDERHKRKMLLGMYNAAKSRAKRKGIEFTITHDDVNAPDTCPLLGIPLIRGTDKAHDNSPSLDRIDPTRGYILGNVHVASLRANTIKSNATPTELRKIASELENIWERLGLEEKSPS